MSSLPARSGTTIVTPYGEARINAAGRILWAEWEVWRRCDELVQSGLWTSNRRGYGNRERVEFFVADLQGKRNARDAAGATETDSR